MLIGGFDRWLLARSNTAHNLINTPISSVYCRFAVLECRDGPAVVPGTGLTTWCCSHNPYVVEKEKFGETPSDQDIMGVKP